ncbi:MAG: guanylate kinase [Alphaproteobacteria bacterium]|nr:guanylate kinase [Alphaproteobacteria bacterium]
MSEVIQRLKTVRRGVMFVIEAPSGTGKTTLIKKLLAQDENLKFSVSVTTRPKREGEVDGVDYYYVTDAEYDKLVKEDAFYEKVDSQYGSRYGTLRSEVDSFINVGQDVVFDMDWVGLRQMKEKAPNDVVSIYMLPPSIKELRKRLEGRNTDSQEVIDKRMALIADKMQHWVEYDYVVICDDPDQTVDTIQQIFSAERMKRVRQIGLKEFTQKLMDEALHG